MIYASETWALKIEDLRRLERAEMRMLRWIAGVKLADHISIDEVMRVMDVQPVGEVIRRSRLRWFGHVERKSEEDGVKRAHNLVLEGKRPRGRPRKTWMEAVELDMKTQKMTCEMAQDRAVWKRLSSLQRPTPEAQGK